MFLQLRIIPGDKASNYEMRLPFSRQDETTTRGHFYCGMTKDTRSR